MSEADIMAAMHKAYIVLLILVGGYAALRGVSLKALWRAILSLPPMRRTAVTIFANWFFNTAFVIVSGVFDPWYWFAFVDAVSAKVVSHQPAGRAQASVAAVYMAQIIMHVVYAASNQVVAEPAYYQILTALALVQLLLLGGWSVGHGGRLADYFRWRRSSPVAVSERQTGVEP